jgi:hypothetical protein
MDASNKIVVLQVNPQKLENTSYNKDSPRQNSAAGS